MKQKFINNLKLEKENCTLEIPKHIENLEKSSGKQTPAAWMTRLKKLKRAALKMLEIRDILE